MTFRKTNNIARPRQIVFAILRRNGNVLAAHSNDCRTHPLAKKYGHRFACRHAEFNACVSYVNRPQDLRGVELEVIRFKRNGNIGCSKPCIPCQEFLRQFPLKRIMYYDENGKRKEL